MMMAIGLARGYTELRGVGDDMDRRCLFVRGKTNMDYNVAESGNKKSTTYLEKKLN